MNKIFRAKHSAIESKFYECGTSLVDVNVNFGLGYN